jgi:hypothetical protein
VFWPLNFNFYVFMKDLEKHYGKNILKGKLCFYHKFMKKMQYLKLTDRNISIL